MTKNKYMIFAIFLAACGSSVAIPKTWEEIVSGLTTGPVMREDFTSTPLGWSSWYTTCGLDCQVFHEFDVDNGVASSTSTVGHLWAVDRNHGDPGGLGDLSMAFYVCLPGNQFGCASNVPNMDLRGATFRARIRFPSGFPTNTGPTSNTRLTWFIQMYDSSIGKYVNMAAIGKPIDIDDTSEWQIIEVSPKFNDWACLGAHNKDAHKYGCNPAHLVLANVNVSLGLIYFPVNRNHIPRGKIDLDWIEVVR